MRKVLAYTVGVVLNVLIEREPLDLDVLLAAGTLRRVISQGYHNIVSKHSLFGHSLGKLGCRNSLSENKWNFLSMANASNTTGTNNL
jgi:hypothetical protein